MVYPVDAKRRQHTYRMNNMKTEELIKNWAILIKEPGGPAAGEYYSQVVIKCQGLIRDMV